MLAESTKTSKDGKARPKYDGAVPLLVVFFCALATALLHHFAYPHPRTTFLYDARSYLSSTAHVCQFFQSVLHFHPDFSFISGKDFLGAIVNDGPVLTGVFAAIFTLAGHVPVNKDWTTFEFIQSIMHALTASLVYLSATRATGMRKAGLAAGLIWATYPAAMVASGRFYNEPLMVLLLMAALYFAGKRPDTIGSTIFGSCFSGMAFLMKPALVAGAGLSYLCLLLGSKKKIRAIALIAAGIVMAFGPWALYTKAFMGHAYFTTPRNSTYNIAMGCDTEVDGCLTSPMTPLTNMYVNDPQPIYFMYTQMCNNTGAYLKMVMRKVTRMYSYPWNDFRHVYFGLDADAQRIWHLLLLTGGLTGILIFLGRIFSANKIDYEQNSVPVLALGWMAAPTIYLLFEANSRYGFTLTPFLAVFCSLPVALFATPGQKKKLIVPLAAAALLTLLIANFDNLSRLDQSKETSLALAPGDVATKTLTLSQSHKPDIAASRVFIMVDGEESLTHATLSINGHDLGMPLKHLRYFYPSKYSEYYVLHELGYSMGEAPEKYRSWRIAEIPAEMVNWSGENKIEVKAGKEGLQLYGESDGRTRHYLSPLYFTPIRLGNASKGLETRLVMPEIKADIAQTSSFKSSAGQVRTLPGGLRINLLLADRLAAPVADPSAQQQGQWQSFSKHFAVTVKDLDPCFYTGKPTELHTNRQVVEAAHSVCAVYTMPRTPGSNAVKLRLCGSVRAQKAGSKVGLLLASTNKVGQPVLISNTPAYLEAGPQWRDFVIEDILPEGELADGPIKLTVAIYPGPWVEVCGYSCDRTSADAIIKDLTLDVTPAYQLDLTGYRLIVL